MRGEGRHRHKRGTRVESNEAALGSILADVQVLTVHLDVIKLHTEHVLQLNIVPVNITGELALVIVPESQIRLIATSFILRRGKIESEHVALKQVLCHHLIEDRSNIGFGKSGVSETNDGLEVVSREDGLLLKNITELLVVDDNLTGGLAVAGTESNSISNEVTGKIS